MMVTVIVSWLLYLLLLERCFCDLSGTASAFDFADEWVLYTLEATNSHAWFEWQQEMSLNVSLRSIGCRNECFLIARPMVSWRIIVMDTTEYYQAEMNDSSSSTTRTIVESDIERTSMRTGQWYNAWSRCRGTRTMPYAYWGSECESGRAPA